MDTTALVSVQLLNDTIDQDPNPLATGKQFLSRFHGFDQDWSGRNPVLLAFNVAASAADIEFKSISCSSVHHNLMRLGIPLSLVLCRSRATPVIPVTGYILVATLNLESSSLLKYHTIVCKRQQC